MTVFLCRHRDATYPPGDGDVSSGGFSPKRWSKSRTEDLTTRSKSCSNLQNGQAPASWGSGSNVPWCQEWARWCGRVSLVVTPGTGSRSSEFMGLCSGSGCSGSVKGVVYVDVAHAHPVGISRPARECSCLALMDYRGHISAWR